MWNGFLRHLASTLSNWFLLPLISAKRTIKVGLEIGAMKKLSFIYERNEYSSRKKLSKESFESSSLVFTTTVSQRC